MGFDIARAISSTTGKVETSGFNVVFKNPIYTAVLITVLLMVIITCFHDDNKKPRTFIYILIVNILVIFMHDQMLITDHREELETEDEKAVTSGIDNITGSYQEESSGFRSSEGGELHYLR